MAQRLLSPILEHASLISLAAQGEQGLALKSHFQMGLLVPKL